MTKRHINNISFKLVIEFVWTGLQNSNKTNQDEASGQSPSLLNRTFNW